MEDRHPDHGRAAQGVEAVEAQAGGAAHSVFS
jgi:hypothetical protein